MTGAMLMGTRKAVVLVLPLVLAGLAAAGCGSDDGTPTTAKRTTPAISAATADQLASLSEQIATDLDAGQTCDAAHAADELSGAVADADLSASLAPGVEDVASRLVDEVNCPPPPPEPEKKEKKEKKPKPEHEQGHDEGHGGGEEQAPPGHSGGVPPGQAKIKGESG